LKNNFNFCSSPISSWLIENMKLSSILMHIRLNEAETKT
jgi:hypothetical protein